MAYSRISARKGQVVNLDVRFLRGGVLTDPYGIYRVEIYRNKIAPENVVDIIELPDPESGQYPSPLIRIPGIAQGGFTLPWTVPQDAVVPDVYIDQWHIFPNNPRDNAGSDIGSDGLGSDHPLSLYTSHLSSLCNRFWVYDDNWYADGGLQTINFGFEPLNYKFHKPEVKPLEVGLMPLPLYDYNYNLVAPIIPYLQATITIKTENDEPVKINEPMGIKIRQGSFRSNPFVLSYPVNSSGMFIGTYKYRVVITLPDGSTRSSGNLFFTIS